MPRFLRENYALLAGIVLPLVLIAVFFAAGRVSVMGIAEPQYDAVFAVNYLPQATTKPFVISADDGKLTIRRTPPPDDRRFRNLAAPEIYVFDHQSKRARRIDIDFGNVVDGAVSDPDLDALNAKGLVTDTTAPDGYEFHFSGSNSHGFFAEMFGGRRYRSRYVLRNGARRIPITGPRVFYSAHFIGWVKQ